MVNLVLNPFLATIVMKKEKIILSPFAWVYGTLKNNRYYKRHVQVKEDLWINRPKQTNYTWRNAIVSDKEGGDRA